MFYDKHRFVIILFSILVFVFLLFGLGTGTAVSGVNGILFSYPTLTATITSPLNGSNIYAGDCFIVSATITCSCVSDGFTDKSLFDLVKPVHAIALGSRGDVAATISISGSASLASGQNATVALGEIPECGGQVSVSWTVCCTGTGPTIITVTPSGGIYSYIVNNPDVQIYTADNLFDRFVKPVYASQPEGEYHPLPADKLISDSITIYQVERPPRLFLDDTKGAGTQPIQYSWPKPADTKITTAYVQQGTVLAGQPVTIMANVVNRGEVADSYTATLMVNGIVENTRELSVPGGTAIPIEFTVTRDDPGNYEVDVNGQKAWFTVTGKVSSQPDMKLILAIFIGAIITTLLGLIIWKLATR